MEEQISPLELEQFFRDLLKSNFSLSACTGSELDHMVTRILRSPPGLVEQALSLEGFPAAEFGRTLMIRFRESRETYLKKIKERKDLFTIEPEDSAQIHFAILLGKLGIHGRLCEEEIQSYLSSEDNWIVSIGAEIIQNALPIYSESLLSRLFDEMERFGPNCFPYKTGEVMASYLNSDRALYDRVAREYLIRKDTFREALLYTFALMKNLPAVAVELILSSAASTTDRVKDTAIIALGSCSGENPAVVAVLRDELQRPQSGRSATMVPLPVLPCRPL